MRHTSKSCVNYLTSGILSKNEPWMIMMIGLPGSGKSTLISNLQAALGLQGLPAVEVASTDALIELEAVRMGITYSEAWDKVNMKTINNQFKDKIKSLISSKSCFILDQTNMSRKSRESKISGVSPVYHKICLSVTVDDKILAERLATRAANTGKVIPPFVMKNMASSFVPPSKSEGWNLIVDVVN